MDSIGGLLGLGRYGDAGGAHDNRAMVFNFLGIGRERVPMTTDGNGSSSAQIAEAHIVARNLATACGSFVLMSDLNS